jgi:hypothetical protein
MKCYQVFDITLGIYEYIEFNIKSAFWTEKEKTLCCGN